MVGAPGGGHAHRPDPALSGAGTRAPETVSCAGARRIRQNCTVTALLFVALGIVLLNVYALAAVCLRGPLFGTRLYRPMLLNIGLSVAPVIVLGLLITGLLVAGALGSTLMLWLVIVGDGLVWLVLLPNSAYLVTELNFSHRRNDDPVPLWYDIVLVLSLALSGVMNALLNVLLAQVVLVLVAFPNSDDPLSRPASWVFVAILLVLIAFGMYLGRYLRFNSWDLLHPGSFVRKLRDHFTAPGRFREAGGFTLVHALLFAILYVLVLGPVVALI